MKLPAQLKQVTMDEERAAFSPYPPLGFYSISESELGNGDCFGLYWPIGRESVEPIVAEVWHDEWRLVPSYSNLASFLKARKSIAEEEGDYLETPSLHDDPRSPKACLDAAKLVLKSQLVDKAIALLETAIAIVPEYTEAHTALWAQYLRLGRIDDAARAALQAIISPSSFGQRPVKALRWLCSLKEAPEFIVDDPIWLARFDLKLVYGGTKENADYPILSAAIEKYLTQSKLLSALVLMQTYAEQMHCETISFQQRYDFDVKNFCARQLDVSAMLPDGPRELVF